MKQIVFFLFICSTNICSAQYPGAAGNNSSTAIANDSSIFVAWATNCLVERGLTDISNSNSGLASFGQDSDGIGPADQTGIVSLGDSGIAILTFANGIFNGPGPDFAVFENSFSDSFLELAHVEVSSDGINFFRFQSEFLQNIPQIGPFDELSDPEKINNLAGKYRGGFGTPFNLDEFIGVFGLNINNITHIKIIDVVGSVSSPYGTVDQNGNFINDPFPTPFPSSGFDLDAVGVMYQTGVNDLNENSLESISVYPNPFTNALNVSISKEKINQIKLYTAIGTEIVRSNDSFIDTEHLPVGVYILKVELNDGQISSRRVIKR